MAVPAIGHCLEVAGLQRNLDFVEFGLASDRGVDPLLGLSYGLVVVDVLPPAQDGDATEEVGNISLFDWVVALSLRDALGPYSRSIRLALISLDSLKAC